MNEFIICIHDVCPQTSTSVLRLLDSLNDIVASALSIAIIPFPYRMSWGSEASVFAETLKSRTEEILLHGLTHKRNNNRSLFSFLIDNADELSDLTINEIDAILEQGQYLISNIFGNAARGFVPPGWQTGKVTWDLLRKHGFDFLVTLYSMRDSMDNKHSLASWSWDCGRVPFLGYMGDAIGSLRYFGCGNVVPCIVLHPRDIKRGFLPRSLRLINHFLEKGYHPITFNKLYHRMGKHVD
jgi:hypothetical protein